MSKAKIHFNIGFFALALASLVGLHACGEGSTDVGSLEAAQGGSGCEGDLGKQEGSSGSYEADSIGSICIKAGQGIFTFACGETDPTGCYDVMWTCVANCDAEDPEERCCNAVEIGGGGTGRDCKAISHTAASSADSCEPEPSPSPSPEPRPSPEPSPSPM